MIDFKMNGIYHLTERYVSLKYSYITGVCQFRGYSESSGLYYFLMITGAKSGHLLKFDIKKLGKRRKYKIVDIKQWEKEQT